VTVQTDSPFLSVVVPAYNEAQRLPDSLRQIMAYLDVQPYLSEVIVADDGSTDATAALADQLSAAHPSLRLLRLDHRGKGFAVRAGVLEVLAKSSRAMGAVEILEKLPPHTDAVIGSRFETINRRWSRAMPF